jgi:hypothetical protein
MPKKLSNEESSVDSSNDYNKDHTKPSTEKDNESPTEPYYYPDEIYDRNYGGLLTSVAWRPLKLTKTPSTP